MKLIYNFQLKAKQKFKIKYSLKIIYEFIFIILAFVYTAHVMFERYLYLEKIIKVIIEFLFILDFLYNVYKTKKRKNYLIKNFWIILSILPFSQLKALQVLRLFHIFRFAKILFFLEHFQIKFLENSTFYHKIKASKYYQNGVGFLVYNAILIPVLMQLVEPQTFQNFGSGFWWAIVTLTTVGYGDIYPLTFWGKIAAGYTLIIGVFTYASIIATISDYVNYLLNNRNKEIQKQAYQKVFELEKKVNNLEIQNKIIIELLKKKK